MSQPSRSNESLVAVEWIFIIHIGMDVYTEKREKERDKEGTEFFLGNARAAHFSNGFLIGGAAPAD